MGRNEVEACVLQFADDNLFMCEDSFSNVLSLKAILRCFELVSGLKVNFHKLKLAGINVDRNFEVYTKTLKCSLMGIPFKYLGLEGGGNPKKKKFWESILSKISARLCAWMGRLLSLARRICLIKSIFTVIPLFYLSLFKAPESVYNKIISIQRRFLWACGRDDRSIAWVRWENLYKQVEEDGLGIKYVRKFNGALIKWKWRRLGEEQRMWKDILVSKVWIQVVANPLWNTNRGGGEMYPKFGTRGEEKGGSKKHWNVKWNVGT